MENTIQPLWYYRWVPGASMMTGAVIVNGKTLWGPADPFPRHRASEPSSESILALLAIKPRKVEDLAAALGFANTRPVRMALARMLDTKQVLPMGDCWIPADMQSFYEDR
jgi:hypothetical protein